MRALHVHSGNIFGGVERMMLGLAPQSAGRTPLESSFALCFDGAVAAALRSAEADVYELPSVRVRRLDEVRAARRALRTMLDRHSWDVAIVHSAWSQAIFGRTIANAKVPLIRWLHAPQPGPGWLEAWSARAVPALVLCNSRYTFENAGPRFDSVPRVIQHPPLAFRPPAPETRSVVRTSLNTAEGAVVIVLAARIEAGKGHLKLLDALARLRPSNWEAWIVGGAQRPEEESLLRQLRLAADALGLSPRVRFLGQRDDVAELLAAADVYCQPNVAADSFGLSFVEALACGLPVITTELGGATEIVDASCGVLVPPGDRGALVAALDLVVHNEADRQRMSAAARLRAREFCDLPAALNALAARLSELSPDYATAAAMSRRSSSREGGSV
jgi:glycosyltransferase involved in cell wall biosynthesis